MEFTEREYGKLSWISAGGLGVKNAFTRRLGEVGDFPYSSNYDPEWLRPERQEAVRQIWQELRLALELPAAGLCFTHQIHGTEIRYVTEAERCMPPLAVVPADCDGLITDRPGVPLCVFTADCVPVLLSDTKAGIIAAVHSGWKGTVKDMMGAAVKKMIGMGAHPENIRAAVGPAIDKCCFETGPEVPEAVYALLGPEAEGLCPPEKGVEGKYMVDLKEVNRRRLMQLGVSPEHIEVSDDCTMCLRENYWSHRATKGRRGTQASIIVLE